MNKVASGTVALALVFGLSLSEAPVAGRSERVSIAIPRRPGIVYSDAALIYRTAKEYSTATAGVIPRMYGSFLPDSVPGQYRYTYTLVNDPASTNTIWKFAFDPVPRPISVSPPPHWRWMFGFFQLEDSVLSFRAMPDTTPDPPGWDSLRVLRSAYTIAHGDSVTFSLVSDRAPSMTMFYVQGYYVDSAFTDTTMKYSPISIWNNSVTGSIIAPGIVTAVPESQGTNSLPSVPQMRAPAPNPTASSSTVVFYLPKAGKALLGVYDVSGRPIQVLTERYYPSGLHSAAWDGSTSAGRRAATGIYFFKLTVDGAQAGARKMVMVR